METHYYQFSDDVDPMIRFREGCSVFLIDGREMHFEEFPEGYVVKRIGNFLSDVSLDRAKWLLHRYGGCAWTSYEIEGGTIMNVKEIRPIGKGGTFR